jgi:hypothetical protein
MKFRSALIPLLFGVGSVCAVCAISPASATIGGVDGPDCVRLWVRALAPNAPSAPNSLYGIMRNTYAKAPPHIRNQDPIDFMAGTCHIDRSLVRIIVEDEAEVSGLPKHWDLPQAIEPKEPDLCHTWAMNDGAREFYHCKPVASTSAPASHCEHEMHYNKGRLVESYVGCGK